VQDRADEERQDETCWTVIRGAAAGDTTARSRFAETYLTVVRAYLGSRWRRHVAAERLEDAVQDVFLDCFKHGGALGRLDQTRRIPFRTFLYGVVRNVALRYEERGAKQRERQPPSEFQAEAVPADDQRLSASFDRAWARAMIARAAARQRQQAAELGEEAQRRVELLRLRFTDGLPIREIAAMWSEDPARVHREYAKAREEFKGALRDEVAFHDPGVPAAVEQEVVKLLELLQGE